jgi:hypothetical protein
MMYHTALNVVEDKRGLLSLFRSFGFHISDMDSSTSSSSLHLTKSRSVSEGDDDSSLSSDSFAEERVTRMVVGAQ